MSKKTRCLNQSVGEVVGRNRLSRPIDYTLPRYSVKLFIIGCFCSMMLMACMWYPVGHDDFSVLGNDVFSNLIRNSSVRRSDPNTGTDRSNGVARLDPLSMTSLSREIFLGKKSEEVMKIFSQAQGHCEPLQQMNLLTCNAIRQWQLKNVGAPIDTSKWEKPTAKLLFRFALSGSHTVTDVELKIIDLTQWQAN